MTDQHRATPDQWNDLGAFASDTRACVLELRARVEALEAGATCPHVRTSDEGTSYCALAEQVVAKESAAPAASSLVERVDRAAIREVAAWLRDRGGYPWAWVAQVLEMEADR